MSAWSWYTRRRWPWRIVIAFAVALPTVVLLYVAGRGFQYRSAEGDAGLYAPAGAGAAVRVRDLSGHWGRIQKSDAWRVIRRRMLKDPVLRRALNTALKDSGLPTLDDLEDERKSPMFTEAMLLRAAGSDASVSLHIGDSLKTFRFCAATQLGFGYYLLSPFARWVYPTERVGGTWCLRIRQGRTDLFVAFAGKLAVASDDRALLESALNGRGRRTVTARPIEGRIDFESSTALADLRRTIHETGLFPSVKLDAARAVRFSADISGPAAFFDAVFEGAETPGSDPPPATLVESAPAACTGFVISRAGTGDIHAWLKSWGSRSAAKGYLSRNVRDGLEILDKAGFASALLPRLESGIAMLTGADVRVDGRSYPGVVFLLPSKDPSGALLELKEVVKKLAGRHAEAREEMRRIGEVEMYFWGWPGLPVLNDFLRPCYAALPGAIVLGNNVAFTEAVIDAAAGRGALLQNEPRSRIARRSLAEHGMAEDGDVDRYFFHLPDLRASLDALLPRAAEWMVDARTDRVKLRAEVEAELRQRGRPAQQPEIVESFNATLERRRQAQEDLLRDTLMALDCMAWAALRAKPVEDGVSIRAVVEFR